MDFLIAAVTVLSLVTLTVYVMIRNRKKPVSRHNKLAFIPVLLLLAHFFGLRGIALAQPAADVLAMLISLPFLLGFLHQLPKSEA